MLGAPVQAAVVVLDSFDAEPGFAQDPVGEPDFGEVVVRDPHMPDAPALEQGDQARRPTA
jgi:hypothetical protein